MPIPQDALRHAAAHSRYLAGRLAGRTDLAPWLETTLAQRFQAQEMRDVLSYIRQRFTPAGAPSASL